MRAAFLFFLLSLSTTFWVSSAIGGEYGEKMPTSGLVLTLDDAISNFSIGNHNEERKFSGYVKGVCKKKGCWMILADKSSYARITFKDYSFFVPTEADHSKALVYGKLNREKLSIDKANHYEEDAGRTATIDSEQFEYNILASSVVLLSQSE